MKASKAIRSSIALLVAASLAFACLALCACGEAKSQKSSETQQTRFEGYWKLSGVEQNGKSYDKSDVEKAYQNSGFIYLLRLDADGDGSFDAYNKAKHQEDISWESTGADKVTIKFEDSVGLAEMSEDQLRLDEGGMVFFFSKIEKSEYDALLKNLGSKPEESSSSSSDSSSSAGSTGVSPEFKKQMDDYEAFFDEYVSFMKQYKDNPSDASLLSKASSIMSRYSTMLSDFKSIKSKSLSAADAAYYSEVSARILKKLSEVV